MKILAVTNIYPSPSNPALGTYVEQQIRGLCEIGLKVDVWYVDRKVGGRGVYLRTSKQLRDRVNSGQYDLVHIMYSGLLADLSTRAVRNIPTVMTIHGSDLLGSKLSPPLQRLSSYLGVLSSRRAARRANGIIAVSPGLRDALPADVDRSKVRIIPCGIDLDRFKPMDPESCRKSLGWDASTLHILFSTRGDPIKRPELAYKAVEALRKTGVRAELHEMCGIAYDQVPVWINASDSLILTSKHEGSPTITKECLACDVPVVSVDVGDVRAQIEGIGGCSINSEDPVELATALGVSSAARRNVGIQGRDRMMQWSQEATARRIHEFYLELADNTASVDIEKSQRTVTTETR
jgi:glycosyltransferase involved in cell wall biosynthesis